MRTLLLIATILLPLASQSATAEPMGYAITITTAFATADPFGNRIDQAFTEPGTGYVNIQNSGAATFIGTIATSAVSAFAGDLSFSASGLVLSPGDSVSIAMPDNSAAVGGFNGPAYWLRPGIGITMDGTFDGVPVLLSVNDGDIHSGVSRTDGFGLTSDSFVLQGGDPWGFDTGPAFALTQANGHFIFQGQVAEPSTAGLFGLAALAFYHRRRAARCDRRILGAVSRSGQ